MTETEFSTSTTGMNSIHEFNSNSNKCFQYLCTSKFGNKDALHFAHLLVFLTSAFGNVPSGIIVLPQPA